jgi:hypothetical protein
MRLLISWHGLTFESAEIANECGRLRRLLNMPDNVPTTSRLTFIYAIFVAQSSLWAYVSMYELDKDKRRKVPQWHVLASWKRQDEES